MAHTNPQHYQDYLQERARELVEDDTGKARSYDIEDIETGYIYGPYHAKDEKGAIELWLADAGYWTDDINWDNVQQLDDDHNAIIALTESTRPDGTPSAIREITTTFWQWSL